jgi:hypothetical protein
MPHDPNFQPLGILVGLHDLWFLFGRCFIHVPWSFSKEQKNADRERKRERDIYIIIYIWKGSKEIERGREDENKKLREKER